MNALTNLLVFDSDSLPGSTLLANYAACNNSGMSEVSASECIALAQLDYRLPFAAKIAGFSFAKPCSSSAKRIVCSGGHVTVLNLDSLGVTGYISSVIGNLPYLTILEMHNNKITGAIPTQIGNLTKLTKLDLLGNQLTGPVPSTVNKLTALVTLDVRNNKLSGTLPSTVTGITTLKTVGISGNTMNLTGWNANQITWLYPRMK